MSLLHPTPRVEPTGELETVAEFSGPMPTGVTVSHGGRVFVNFPKWGDDVPFTVAEVRDGEAVAYPSQTTNDTEVDRPEVAFVSVQSVVVDPADRLWALDTGSPLFTPPKPGGAKMVCIDLATDRVVQTVTFPETVVLPTTYLNDVRFDLGVGEAGTAYITDSAEEDQAGLIVVDLASGESWRRLHGHPSTLAEQLPDFLPFVEGKPFLEHTADGQTQQGAGMGADGIAISADGTRLYYCPLGSRRLYSVSTDALVDRTMSDDEVAETVVDEGDKGGAADGLETDAEGRVYATNYEHHAVTRRGVDGEWETLVSDPRLIWPDTLSLAGDGYLYVTANQLNRQAKYHRGHDLRQKPYSLFRVKVDGTPVRLR
ncbi:MAG TPA: L-dopachrome tautomerase-related protein [Rubricoccaceae bacterium]|jgi:sugar lactone lactonase YvrE